MEKKSNQPNTLDKVKEKTMRRLEPEAKILADSIRKDMPRKKTEAAKKPKDRSRKTVEEKETVSAETIMESCREAVTAALKIEAVQTQIADKMSSEYGKHKEEDDAEVDELLERELLKMAGCDHDDNEAAADSIAQELALEVIVQVFELYRKRSMTEAEESAAYERILMSESSEKLD